jgi:hypothetical protein
VNDGCAVWGREGGLTKEFLKLVNPRGQSEYDQIDQKEYNWRCSELMGVAIE